MVDDISPMHQRMQKKTRSASICATGGSIETIIHGLPAGYGGHPENGGTPSGVRRTKVATRSQSTKMARPRSVKKRPQQQQQQANTLQESRSYFTSEPRLTETQTPSLSRKASQRRAPQYAGGHRKSNAFLDVPNMNMHTLRVSDREEGVDCLRNFNASKGGVINRGDSFRRRRSRSNSLAPVSPVHPRNALSVGGSYMDLNNTRDDNPPPSVEVFYVEMLGSPGVGKQALVSQFRTSDCINAYDGPECDEAEQNISIILNGIESELKFTTGNTLINKDALEAADAFLVVFSVVDKESFSRAKQILKQLHETDLLRTRATILVANKIDLARSRAVSTQDGKCLACTYETKYIEVSVGINHNCDELLAGTLTQIRLRKERNLIQGNEHGSQSHHWYKKSNVVAASMKARQMFTWLFGKEDSKFKNCENLQIL